MNKNNNNYRLAPILFIAILFWILLICIGCTKLDSTDEDGIDSKKDSGSTENDSSSPPFTSIPPNSTGGESFDSGTDSASEPDGETNTADGGSGEEKIVDGRADSSKTRHDCNEEGALQCVANASNARQVCKNGIWQNTNSCEDDEICDTSNIESTGTCVSAMSLCEGRANVFVCVNGVMHECNVDGISISQQSCESQLHCQTGLPESKCAVCIPGLDHKCEQQELLQCDSEGMGYVHDETCSNETPCNAEAGACTDLYCLPNTYRCSGGILYRCNDDGSAFEDSVICDSGICDQKNGQCDVCVAAQDTKCIGDEPAVCDSEGQDWDIGSCSENYPYCVGQGVCKKCGTNAHCEPAPDCMLAICTNTGCKYINDSDAFGEDCNGGQGYCNATGKCLECLLGDDCTSPTPVCSDGVCIECKVSSDCSSGSDVCKTSTDPTQNKCVGCVNSTDCDDGWICADNNECYKESDSEPTGPVCGNGILEEGEQCDDGDQNGRPATSGGLNVYDGCGPNCKIHYTWGCPVRYADANNTSKYLKRQLQFGNTVSWVWTLPNDGQDNPARVNEPATCAGPCLPVTKGNDGRTSFGYCDNTNVSIAGQSNYKVECINGACLIPCGIGDSCPAGYDCANNEMFDIDDVIAEKTNLGTKSFKYCIALDTNVTPPFEYKD